MRFGAHIGHGIESQGDVESLLIRLAGRGFDAGSGCDAGDNHLRDSVGLQLRLQIGTRKRAPSPLGHDDIAVWRSSSGIRSLNPSGNVEKRRGCSVRPGALPATLTRTTGRSR